MWARDRDPEAADAKAHAERIEHTIEHLFEKHAS